MVVFPQCVWQPVKYQEKKYFSFSNIFYKFKIKVALKRIPNVLQSENNAKKVLRELCILRRITHPNIISIKHAFVMPSDNGPWKYINGKFEPCSIDLYLALEYCVGGDFSKLIGQLTENEVRDLMFQLLTAIDYLHTQNIWHRDLKSANILLTIESGEKIVKVIFKLNEILLNFILKFKYIVDC